MSSVWTFGFRFSGFLRISALGFRILLFPLVATAADSGPEPAVPNEVTSLVGTYSGTWTNFGIDPQGQVVQRSTWTDTMKAEKPVREPVRAFVMTEDNMVFSVRPGAPL